MLLTMFFLLCSARDDLQRDILFIRHAHDRTGHTEHAASSFTFRQTSELKLAMSGMVRVYQVFVSPQGPPSCNFTVTCSHFLTRAVQKYGFVHGLLMGGDRLFRCNRGGRKFYRIDPGTGHAIDYPVETYYIGTSRHIREDYLR
jgi:putative component of membrane protein insertase Oxa1/YidC/SpoIIIJ protein YidD